LSAPLAALEQGSRVIEKVTQAQADNLRYRNQQARTHAAQARVLSQAGKTAEARRQAESALALGETLVREDRAYLVDLARYRALCAATVADGTQARYLAEAAVKAVGEAVEEGFDNLHALKTDPSLVTLQTRDDFRKILARTPPASPDSAPR
jgi:hypothetical protein